MSARQEKDLLNNHTRPVNHTRMVKSYPREEPRHTIEWIDICVARERAAETRGFTFGLTNHRTR